MSAEPSKSDELEARQVRIDLQANWEAATNSAWRSHEIKIDESDWVIPSLASRDGPGVRATVIVSVLVASCGLAWIATSTLPSLFGTASVDGSNGNRLVDHNAASPSLPEESLNSSAPIPDSKKGDRLQIHGASTPETDWEASADASEISKLISSSAIGHENPPLTPARPTASASKHSTVAQQHTSSGRRASNLHARAKITPVPETRPTTIKGWMLREVINDTAVLEGPHGVWRARRGDTVPGVGRVDSIVRWGDRWIVATSEGLISTP